MYHNLLKIPDIKKMATLKEGSIKGLLAGRFRLTDIPDSSLIKKLI